jgi:fibronectin-binding autotransporter adhesin
LPSVTVASGSSGVLMFEQDGTTAASSLSGAVTLNNNLTVSLASYVTTGSLTLQGGITGAGNLTINNASTTAGAISFTSAPLNFSGTITNAGAGAGSTTISSNIGPSVQGVTQNSATSSLTLAGTSTYTAPTAVSAGTLVVSGSLAGSVNVAAGATLASGNNTTSQIAGLAVASSPSVTGGIVAPGGTGGSGVSSIGQLNLSGSATLGSASGDANAAHLQIEIGGTGDGAGVGLGGPNTTNPGALQYDRVTLTSGDAVTLTNVNLDITTVDGYTPSNPSQTGSTFNLDGHIFFLITGASNVNGTFANQGGPFSMLPGYNTITGVNGQLWAIDYTANFSTGSFAIGAGDDVAIMAIPEPNSVSMLAASLGLALGMQRFRRRGHGRGR